MMMASNDAVPCGVSTPERTENSFDSQSQQEVKPMVQKPRQGSKDRDPGEQGRGFFSRLKERVKAPKCSPSDIGVHPTDGGGGAPHEPAVHYESQTGTLRGVPDISAADLPPEYVVPPHVPPIKLRETQDAPEPPTGAVLEMWDGAYYHYGVYVEKGLVLGVHNPPAALSEATVEMIPISLFFRVVHVPPVRPSVRALKRLQGEKYPYNALTHNCYTFCCELLELDDDWDTRRLVQRTTGFYDPNQQWNDKPVPLVADSRVVKVADAVLAALAGVAAKPIRDIVNKLKPLNVLHILSSCDWTLAGIVEMVILLAELFGVFWTPPDITPLIMSLLDDWEMQGPEDLAAELVPIILGGIGLVVGFTQEKVGRLVTTAVSTLKSCKDLGLYGLEIVKLLAKWFFPKNTPGESDQLHSIENAVLDLEAIESNNLTALLKDKNLMTAFIRTLDAEEEKARKLSSKAASPDVVGSVNALLARIATTRSLVHKAKEELSTRPRPVVVMISGRPGIGKTHMARALAQKVVPQIGGDQRVGLVPREVDHWDAYRGENVVLWDDYGMANVIKDALKLQELADTCPVTLNCDRIENKGKMFESDVIVITTNAPNPAPMDYVNMEAVCRRVDFLVYADSPTIEQAKKDKPGDPNAWKPHFKSDHSHLNLVLAPQGGFDRNGNTPHGKGPTQKVSLASLTARVAALVHERRDDFQLQGPAVKTYNFDSGRVAAFRQLAKDNGYSLVETMRVGTVLKDVTDMEGLIQGLQGVRVNPCQIVYRGTTYSLQSGSGGVKIQPIVSQKVQTQSAVHTAVLRLKRARVRYYVKALQEVISTLLQMAGSAFVVSRVVKRVSETVLWTVGERSRSPPPVRSPDCKWVIEPEDFDDEGKKGKNKKGRGRKHTAFSSKGLSDEEYDEYKKIREERGGKYSIQEYLEDRNKYEQEVTFAQANEENFTEADAAKIRQRIFRPTRKQRKEERAQLGLVTGSEIRKRKADDFKPSGRLWADDQREVDYGERIDFEAPPSIWSRIVPFGTGWGFWVSPTLLITATHVVPRNNKEFFNTPVEQIHIHRSGEFTRMRFPKAVRTDLVGMELEEGAPEGTVCSILVKRNSGEMLPLAVRMGSHATMKVQGKVIGGQLGMLLTGANAKNMDLGTTPGDCGSPYIYKRGNEYVVIGVHAAAARGGNTVIAAVQSGEGEATLEGGNDKGTYCGAPIISAGGAPQLSTKTKFWRSSTCELPPGTYEPAYLGGRDPRVETGPSLQQVLRDQLKAFTAPRGRPPNPCLLDQAVKTIENVLDQTLDTVKEWSFSQACESLDKTTSSGWPHHIQKNQHWNGQSFTGPLADQASKANLIYEQGKSMMPVYTAALKDELVKPSKIYGEPKKKRLLWGADLGTMIRCARAWGGLLDEMKAHCVQLPIRVGININEDGPLIFERHARYKNHIDADYSAWDSTQQRVVMEAALKIMNKFSPRPDLAAVVAQDLLAPSQLDVGDYVVRVSEGLPSGVPCTSQLNSIMHWLTTLVALSEATGLNPDVVQANSCFSFYGDDEIVSTDLDVDVEVLTLKLKAMGLKPTPPDKSDGPLKIHDKLEGLSFLRRTIRRDQTGYFGTLEQSSIERQLYWTRGPNHQDPQETMVPHNNRCIQLMELLGEAALHGRKFYNKISRMIIQEVKEGGMDFYVPRFEPMFRWMRFSDLDSWEGDRNLAPEFVNDDGVE
ncbi:nonstructural polyprotein [Norovirus GVII]|nr:nonstructural polyprotein [Norovirus GVII]